MTKTLEINPKGNTVEPTDEDYTLVEALMLTVNAYRQCTKIIPSDMRFKVISDKGEFNEYGLRTIVFQITTDTEPKAFKRYYDDQTGGGIQLSEKHGKGAFKP